MNNTQPFEPYEGMEPYIFISYSHEDRPRVLPILETLNQRGYRVWYDEGIPWTEEWPAVIEDHLRNCGVFVAFHSRASVESRYCRSEIYYALHMHKPILSVYLEDTQLKRGLGLQLLWYQSIKLASFPNIDDFITRLEGESAFLPCRKSELHSKSDISNRHTTQMWLKVSLLLLLILSLSAFVVYQWINIIRPPQIADANKRYGEWSEWSESQPPSPPFGCTVDIEPKTVKVKVPPYTEYRYGRWIGATSNWCKEYGEALHGGTYTIQETEWSTVRALDTNTHWLCGHYDSEHPSHIHSSGAESRGYPMWTKYIVDGYDDPEFYWEETRLVDTSTHTEYRWRLVYYDYTVYFDANDGEGRFAEMTVTNGETYGQLPTPYRTNYDFVGWFTEPKGGYPVSDKSIVDLSGNQTLYAHWKYNPST